MPIPLALLAAAALAQPAPSPPNILFIMADDHAYQAISAYGSTRNETPNIDRIANEGVRLDRCFVTNSICGPSRAVILTSKHSHINGFKHNGDQFDGTQQTYPKLLQHAGYQTALIGKWHLKTDPTGFDHSERLIGQGPYYNPPMIRNGQRIEHTGYTTDIITNLALEWLTSARDETKPFYLMVQHKAPHRNWQPSPDKLHLYDDITMPEPDTLFDTWEGKVAAQQQEMTVAHHLSDFDLKLTPPTNLTDAQRAAWDAAYDPKNQAFREAELTADDRTRWQYQRYAKDYLRCIASVDEGVGKILDTLDELDLADNTIVVYTSDQGWYLGEHGWCDKRWMYEESFRTPMLIRWPNAIKPATTSTALAQNLDFAPTFLAAAGVDIPDDMQGISLLPMLTAEDGLAPEGWRESLYYHYIRIPRRPHGPQARGRPHRPLQTHPLLRARRVGALRPPQRPRRDGQSLRQPGIRRNHPEPQARTRYTEGPVPGRAALAATPERRWKRLVTEQCRKR